MDITNDI